MRQLRAIVFDLDGTIADTIPLTVYSLKEVTRELTGKILSDAEVLKEFGPIDTEIIKRLVDNDKREQSPELYIKHFSENFNIFIKPIDGIRELLKYITQKGIKIGLFTGRSLRVTNIILEKLDLKDYFNVVIAGDHTNKPKPDPEGIFKALEILGVSSSESAYVGDYEVDILASREAGSLSVLALWSSTATNDLIKIKPDLYFTKPQEFIEWLKDTHL